MNIYVATIVSCNSAYKDTILVSAKSIERAEELIHEHRFKDYKNKSKYTVNYIEPVTKLKFKLHEDSKEKVESVYFGVNPSINYHNMD